MGESPFHQRNVSHGRAAAGKDSNDQANRVEQNRDPQKPIGAVELVFPWAGVDLDLGLGWHGCFRNVTRHENHAPNQE